MSSGNGTGVVQRPPDLSLAVDNDGYPLLLAAVYDINAEGGNP